MLQKGSFLVPSDTSGVYLMKIIQTRRCSTRLHAKSGKFIRIVIRQIKTKLIKKRKRRMRGLVIRSNHYSNKADGMVYKFDKNAAVILKKRMNTFGKDVIGPTCKRMKIKKFRASIVSIF